VTCGNQRGQNQDFREPAVIRLAAHRTAPRV
jgi:hypothetical protein